MNFSSYSIVFNGKDPGSALAAASEGNHSFWAAASGNREQAAAEMIREIEETAVGREQVSKAILESCFKTLDPVLSEMKAEVSLAGVMINNAGVQIFNIGNARVLRFARGTLTMHTDDHTEAYERFFDNSGKEPKEYNDLRFRDESLTLKRVPGKKGSFRPQFYPSFEPHQDDALVLCTFSFWRYLSIIEMELDYRKSAGPEEWLRIMARRVMMRAGQRIDNENFAVTAIMAE